MTEDQLRLAEICNELDSRAESSALKQMDKPEKAEKKGVDVPFSGGRIKLTPQMQKEIEDAGIH